MEYRTADRIGNTGLSALTSRMMLQKDIGLMSGLKEASKAKIGAAMTRVQSKFDPLNIIRMLTFKSPMLTSAAGRLMGRSKKDISYFTGGRYGYDYDLNDSTGTKNTQQTKFQSEKVRQSKKDGVYYSKIGPGRIVNIKSGDGLADIMAKLYNLTRVTVSDEKRLKAQEKAFDEETQAENRRMLEDLFSNKEEESKEKAKKIKDPKDGPDGIFSMASASKMLGFIKNIFSMPAFLTIAGVAVAAIIAMKFPAIAKWLDELSTDFNNKFPKSGANDIMDATKNPTNKPRFQNDFSNISNNRPPVSVGEVEHLQTVMALESYGGREVDTKRSSAKGPYQFTDDTWKAVVKQMGENWKPEDVFDLEKSTLAAQFLKNQLETNLEKKLKRQLQPDELYLAHLMGQPEAAKVLASNVNTSLTPSAIGISKNTLSSNPEVFYNDPKTMKSEKTIDELFKSNKERYGKKLELIKKNDANEVTPMMTQVPNILKESGSPVQVGPREVSGKITKAIPKNESKTTPIPSPTPLTDRLQQSTKHNVENTSVAQPPIVNIVSPTTNNVMGGGKQNTQQISGVPVSVRNDESALFKSHVSNIDYLRA